MLLLLAAEDSWDFFFLLFQKTSTASKIGGCQFIRLARWESWRYGQDHDDRPGRFCDHYRTKFTKKSFFWKDIKLEKQSFEKVIQLKAHKLTPWCLVPRHWPSQGPGGPCVGRCHWHWRGGWGGNRGWHGHRGPFGGHLHQRWGEDRCDGRQKLQTRDMNIEN
jgi:hypothetical protein